MASYCPLDAKPSQLSNKVRARRRRKNMRMLKGASFQRIMRTRACRAEFTWCCENSRKRKRATAANRVQRVKHDGEFSRSAGLDVAQQQESSIAAYVVRT